MPSHFTLCLLIISPFVAKAVIFSDSKQGSSLGGGNFLRQRHDTMPASLANLQQFDASRTGAMLGAWLMPNSKEADHAIIERSNFTVTYAVFTCNVPKYREKLVSLMETWAAKPLKEGRFFAVGARDYKWPGDGIVRGDCDDAPGALACKEATIIEEGAKRGSDWLVISGEDNYIDTAKFDAMLAQQPDDDQPKALGIVGCGGGSFCPDLRPSGGLCGGGGYALNRAALRQMVQPGEDKMMHEYMVDFKGYPSDMATSCVIKKRGVRMVHPTGGSLIGGGTLARKQYELYMQNGFLTLHYMTPDAMRWVYAMMQHDDAGARQLEGTVFDDKGCCSKCTTAPGPEGKQQQIQACRDGQMGSI